MSAELAGAIRVGVLWARPRHRPHDGAAMKQTERTLFRCAIYTRKSTEHNLDLEFNSLDAQREACEAYIKSQAHEGWRLVHNRYDDGAFSGNCNRNGRRSILSQQLRQLGDIHREPSRLISCYATWLRH
jgi:resolvase-like protein